MFSCFVQKKSEDKSLMKVLIGGGGGGGSCIFCHALSDLMHVPFDVDNKQVQSSCISQLAGRAVTVACFRVLSKRRAKIKA